MDVEDDGRLPGTEMSTTPGAGKPYTTGITGITGKVGS
jgi:hypothetical protein